MWKNIVVFIFFMSLSVAQIPNIVAHRGASRDAPENTLAAFELAWEKGADAIEGDFRLTKDNKIVCIHDRTTERTAQQNLVVSESTLAQLRKLDVGIWKDEKWQGQKIPTFQEVVATMPAGKKIYVEIKSSVKIVPFLAQEIVDLKIDIKQIVIIAFDKQVIVEMKKYYPLMKAYLLSNFLKKKQQRRIPSTKKILDTLRKINADGIDGIATFLVGKKFVNAIHDAGFEYHTWTINDKATALYFQSLGVESITTDRPYWLRQKLENKRVVIEQK